MHRSGKAAGHIYHIVEPAQAGNYGAVMIYILASDFNAYQHGLIRSLLRIDLQYRNFHFSQSTRDIGDKGYPVICVDLHLRLVNACTAAARAFFPTRGYPTIGIVKVVHTRYNVGTITLVYGYAVPLCDKSDDGIPGQRVATTREFDLAPDFAVNDNTTVGLNVFRRLCYLDLRSLGYRLRCLLRLYYAVELIAQLYRKFGYRKTAITDSIEKVIV